MTARSPRVVAVMQARMGSTRLPRKSLTELVPGLPLAKAVADRVRAVPRLDGFVLATTIEDADAPLADAGRAWGLEVVRGPVLDVLERFGRAAETSRADVIVRVTADDPFKDPDVVARAVDLLLTDPSLDYVSNTVKPTYPEGLDIEVVRRPALERARREATLASDREHVTPFIWRQPNLFKTLNFERPGEDLSGLRWTLDYPEDLEFARAAYGRLHSGGAPFREADVLALLAREPSVRALSTSFKRNQGYLDSLAKERKT